VFHIRSKKSSSFKFWLVVVVVVVGGGCSLAALPLGASLWLSAVITLFHMHVQYDQLTTEPALWIHMKNLYSTIKLHVKACNGNYLQLGAMTDICLKKLLKTEVLVEKPLRLQAGWCLQVHPVCVDCLYWPCLIFHTSMHISGHMHKISWSSRPQWCNGHGLRYTEGTWCPNK